jgi:hypothetical protein
MGDASVVRRDSNGRWLERHPAGHLITSGDDARTLANKRWAKTRKSVQSRLLKEAQAIDADVQTWHDAIGLGVADQYVKLMDQQKPDTDSMFRVAQMAGGMPLPGELQAQQAQAQGNTLQIGEADAVLVVLMRANAFGNCTYNKHDDSIVDGTAQDIDVRANSTQADSEQTGMEGG